MPDIVLYDKTGQPVTYSNADSLTVDTPDGEETAKFTYGDLLSDAEVELDFSDGDQVVAVPDGYLIREATIKQPETLVPENIVKDVVVAGVLGSHSNPRDIATKPIRFYDPWGNVIYGYTRAEMQELTTLPTGPALPGLVFGGWTHALSSLKNEPYFADVGPYYKRASGEYVDVLIIQTLNSSEAVNLVFYGRNSTMTIDWGDGSAVSTVSVSTGSSSTNATTSHTYATPGEYVISVSMSSTYSCTWGYNPGSYYYNLLNIPVSTSATIYGIGHNNDNYIPISFLGGPVYSSQLNYLVPTSLHSMYRLQFVSLYTKQSCTYKKFMNCTSLKAIAGPGLGGVYVNSLRCANSLERLYLDSLIQANALNGCRKIKEVRFASGNILDVNMNSKWAMLMTTETPPTIGATDPVWGIYPIYVPDSAVDTYKTADGWSNAADYIKPQSEYPD